MPVHDIEPIAALESNTAELVDRCRERRSPIVITQDGRASVVLLDIDSYRESREAFAILKMCLDGERSVRAGQAKPLAQHEEEMAAYIAEKRMG